MASIEEDALRDMYQIVRMITNKLSRRRDARRAQRMRDPQTRDGARLEELRELLAEMRDERRNNPEFANAVDNLSEDQRSAMFEAEARRVQENRDRLDNDPNLTPEDLDREREVDEQNRDRDDNGIDDNRDRDGQTEEIVEERRDPDRDGIDNAVEERQAERDAADRAKQEEQRRDEERRAEEGRGGDVAPAVAAAGATAVVADEVLDEVQEEQAAEDQQRDEPEILNEDGTAPPVIGEDAQQPGVDQDGLDQDRILDEDGAAPAVIGDDPQQPGVDQDGLDQDRILDEDGAAPAVIGEDAQQPGVDQDGLDQDRVLDEDGAAPAVIGERRVAEVEEGVAGPQPGFPTGGDQVAAAEEEARNTEERPDQLQQTSVQGQEADGQAASVKPDAIETTLKAAREEQGATQTGRVEQNGQRPGLSQEQITRLREFQQADHAPAAEATRLRPGQPVEAGVGGKNAGARAAELRTEKTPSRTGGKGIGE
jgi:hypothetical protein